MKANDIFNSATEDAKRNIKYAKERALELRKERKAVMPILKLLAPLLDESSDHVYLNVGSLTDVRVSMRRLEGFKDQRLTRLLFAIMCLDGVKEQTTEDWAEALNRDYHFIVGDRTEITVSAYVKSDSPTCRKVKIGEEMKLVAQYKIECD